MHTRYSVNKAVEARWDGIVATARASHDETGFPAIVREGIVAALDGGAEGGAAVAVIAGFFYRDLNANGDYDPGEELEAALLGAPSIGGADIAPAMAHNCYWFGPLESGETYTVRYDVDGAKQVERTVTAVAGLNLLHLPVVPVKRLVHVVVHSHFDTEWVYTYEECLQRVEIPNINQRLDLLERYPAHIFCMDEECVTLPFLERSNDRYAGLLRRGILEGTIEPKGIITQQELIMPYGEALIRNITMGEILLSELVGDDIRPTAYWSVDQYGISFQMPQILAKAGRPYFLSGEYVGPGYGPACAFERIPFSNPKVFDCPDYWLEGLDGSRVLVHRSQYAKAEVEPPPFTTDASLDTEMVCQGWDNYPPDPQLVDKVKKLNASDERYRYIVTSSPSFFKVSEKVPDLPVLETESFITYWSGVYETRIAGRLQNRHLENTMLSVEPVATFAHLEGMSYPSTLFDAWYLLLLNQHHDPLMTPMATPALFDNAVTARYDSARALLEGAKKSVLSWLGIDIVTNERDGQPVIVFNPYPSVRTAIVEAEVPGGLSLAEVRDNRGRAYAAQVVGSTRSSTTLAIQAEDLPAAGWRTFYITAGVVEGESSLKGIAVSASERGLENEHVRIDIENGKILRIIEKDTGTEVMRADESAGINEVIIWKDEGCISVIRPVDSEDIVCFVKNPDAVVVGRSGDVSDPVVEVLEAGPVRGVVKISYSLDYGRFIQYVSLESGSRVVRFKADVEWDPVGKVSPYDGRRIRVAFNTTYNDADIHCDIPFGVIRWEQSETIRPINSWLEAGSGDTGVAFCHNGPPSIQVVDDTVYMTLFRSVTEPEYDKEDPLRCHWDNPEDEAIDPGRHVIDYSVYVHPGDWRSAQTPAVVRRINREVYVRVANRHGSVEEPLRPGERSFLSLEPADLVVAAFKPTEYSDDGAIIRFFNPTDAAVDATLSLGLPHVEVSKVNFREEFESAVEGEGPYSIRVAPHEIVTVKAVARIGAVSAKR